MYWLKRHRYTDFWGKNRTKRYNTVCLTHKTLLGEEKKTAKINFLTLMKWLNWFKLSDTILNLWIQKLELKANERINWFKNRYLLMVDTDIRYKNQTLKSTFVSTSTIGRLIRYQKVIQWDILPTFSFPPRSPHPPEWVYRLKYILFPYLSLSSLFYGRY